MGVWWPRCPLQVSSSGELSGQPTGRAPSRGSQQEDKNADRLAEQSKLNHGKNTGH